MIKESVVFKFILSSFLIFILILACSCIGASSTTTATSTKVVKEVTTSSEMIVPKTSLATAREVVTTRPTTGEFDINAYRLLIDGLVSSPLSLAYEAILKYPAITKNVWLVCPGYFETNQDWTGVPLALLLAEAGINAGANRVEFYASDGYHVGLTLVEAENEGTFIAYEVDGETLSKEDGYPLRLVTTKDGSYWVRWLVHIQVS